MFDLSTLLEKATALFGAGNAAELVANADPAALLEATGIDPAAIADLPGADAAALLAQVGFDGGSAGDGSLMGSLSEHLESVRR
jgi:hypothetical protein